jgi:putative SOS response-associated peptidase YedK
VCGRTTSTTPRDTLLNCSASMRWMRLNCPSVGTSHRLSRYTPWRPARVALGSCGLFAGGLVPSWAKNPRIGTRLVNARSETLGQRPAFRSLVSTRRALLPVLGFYEWRRPEPGSPAPKQPFYFHRADGEPLVFAGLWDLWKLAPATLVLSHQERSRALARRQRSNRPQGTVLLPGPMEVMNSDDYIRPSGLGRLAFKG